MESAAFDEENDCLDKPADMTADQCNPLSVCRTQMANGIPIVISCWRPDKAELEEIIRTGRVWLMVAGRTMPPAKVLGVSPWKWRNEEKTEVPENPGT